MMSCDLFVQVICPFFKGIDCYSLALLDGAQSRDIFEESMLHIHRRSFVTNERTAA